MTIFWWNWADRKTFLALHDNPSRLGQLVQHQVVVSSRLAKWQSYSWNISSVATTVKVGMRLYCGKWWSCANFRGEWCVVTFGRLMLFHVCWLKSPQNFKLALIRLWRKYSVKHTISVDLAVLKFWFVTYYEIYCVKITCVLYLFSGSRV